MAKSTPQEIADAVKGVLNSTYKSTYDAERETGVSRQTIGKRLQGRKPRNEGHESQMRLS
jgi:hypothetical protein